MTCKGSLWSGVRSTLACGPSIRRKMSRQHECPACASEVIMDGAVAGCHVWQAWLETTEPSNAHASVTMNEKPRCEATGKVIYKRKDLAHNAMLRMEQARPDGKPMSIYQCEGCTEWHFGHTPGQDYAKRRPLKRMGVL